MVDYIRNKINLILNSKYRGQRVMTLGFIIAVIGAIAALFGKGILALSGLGLTVIISKIFMIIGWLIMLLGFIVVILGLLITWSSLFSGK